MALHGCYRPGECVWIGGLDVRLGELMRSRFEHAGISAVLDGTSEMSGRLPGNICNRGASGQGCQLEISQGPAQNNVRGVAQARPALPAPAL